jgi:SAM-dependent methyltransferase
MASTTPTSSVIADLDRERVHGWRESWDDVMASFMPGLPGFEVAMAAAAEAVCAGPPADVLDLGGGPGVLADRMAVRWPRATVRLLDLDPVLLALAEAGASPGVTVHHGDLASSAWVADLAGSGPMDLVTVVMTMHYLPDEQARRLYRDARQVLRPGGLLVVADLMPNDDVPSVMNALHPAADEAAAGLAWTRWWDRIAAEPAFEPQLRHRRALFADRQPAEFTPDERWHRDAARASGFGECGVIWRCGTHAAVCAIA